MKKTNSIIIAIIILIVVIGGGYVIFHKSGYKTPAASSANASTSSTPAVNNAVLTTKTNSSLGQYLADPSGKALYAYGSDTSGVSNCTGSCLSAWPAYQDKGATTDLPAGVGTITRTDNGQVQYTYNGLPLYYFASDSPGQVTGNGVSGFTAAKPAATSSPASTSTTPTSPSSSSSSSSSYPSYN